MITSYRDNHSFKNWSRAQLFDCERPDGLMTAPYPMDARLLGYWIYPIPNLVLLRYLRHYIGNDSRRPPYPPALREWLAFPCGVTSR
jgi:hypothetical protein